MTLFHQGRQRLLLSSFLVLKMVASSVKAQENTIFACDLLRDCQACMDEGTSCVFAAGVCSDECTQPEGGASCYSEASHPELTSVEICELYDEDSARCTSQKTCSDCVSTVKSDLQSCQWYPTAFDNLGACFGGGEGPFGPGELTCAGTTDPPTPTPTGNSNTCQSVTDCQSCVDANCAWSPYDLICEPDCTGVDDIVRRCYSNTQFSTSTTFQICEIALADVADQVLCFAQETCQTCLETTKSDGTTCQWYLDDLIGIQWCNTGGCNSQDGICGSTTCESSVISENINMTTVDSNATNTSNATPENMALCGRKNYCFTCTSTIQSDGVTPCSWYQDLSTGEEWCDVGGCNANGICGESDESACRVPTDPPESETSPPDIEADPPASPLNTDGDTTVNDIVASKLLSEPSSSFCPQQSSMVMVIAESLVVSLFFVL